jgi:Polyketide cyclase / dehydrase and lipid transport
VPAVAAKPRLREKNEREGPPEGGRYILLKTALGGAPAMTLGLSQDPQAASAEDVAAQVSVREKSGVYTVAARFRVEGSADTALAVLTDYERIPQFMPGVKTSVVRERAADRVVSA